MNDWSSAVIGLGIGAVLGYMFGIRGGDVWIGGSIAVTASIAGYGVFAYPRFRTRWSGPHSKFWYSLTTVLALVLMFFTPNSRFLSDDFSVVVLLGCLWAGGVYAGVALAEESPDSADEEATSVRESPPNE